MGRGTLCCVNHQEEFHEIVGIGECALHKEDILSADAFLVGYFKLAIGELGEAEVANGATELLADFLGKVTGGPAGEDEKIVVHDWII